MCSTSSPPRSFSKEVMSNLPERFLASWHAKQFSLRIGATSLMKETDFGACARAVGTAPSNNHAASAAMTAHRTHEQKRERDMDGSLRLRRARQGGMNIVYRSGS